MLCFPWWLNKLLLASQTVSLYNPGTKRHLFILIAYLQNKQNCNTKESVIEMCYLFINLRASSFLINPILHTWFKDSCFICDGSSTIQVFPLLFNIGMVTTVLFQVGEVLVLGRGAAYSGGVGGWRQSNDS